MWFNRLKSQSQYSQTTNECTFINGKNLKIKFTGYIGLSKTFVN